MKHTPKPWKWTKLVDGKTALFSHTPDGTGILIHDAKWDVSHEDKCLIATAPDLLEACKDLMCLRLAEPDDEEAKAIVGYIKYAIAKAQGETK